MQALIDTNILLDVLLNRAPWDVDAGSLWIAHDQRRFTGYIVATALTDVFYIARKLIGNQDALAAVRISLNAFNVCPVDLQVLQNALALPGNDFEDNLQIACATLLSVDAIVSRDKTGFRATSIPVLTPAELLAQLGP